MGTRQSVTLITLVIFFFFFSAKNGYGQDAQKPIAGKYWGNYTAIIETEGTTTGTAGITYNFSISKDKVQLTTTTYHEPIRCNGTYRALEKNGMLELYYTGKEQFCSLPNANFYIKQ